MKKILTGVKPTGDQMHLGNLLGAVLPFKKLTEKMKVISVFTATHTNAYQGIRRFLAILEQQKKNVKDATFDRAHFFSYGDFSLIFEIVYYVVGPDYNKYMDIQQQINFAIKEEFERKGIEFAFPTQTLYVNKTDSK